MMHRQVLGVVAALAVAVAVSFAIAQTGTQDKQTQPGTRDAHAESYDRCAKACSDCQRACDSCATHCAQLLAEGKKEHLKTLQTCQDCADFCVTAAQIVARRGPFADLICTSCAEACARCGKACEQHASHDKVMAACAEECRKCEKACREMISHLGQGKERK
jgi:hypothetical protein